MTTNGGHGRRALALGGLASLALILATGCLRKPPDDPSSSSSESDGPIIPPEERPDPVIAETNRPSGSFLLEGKPFCFAGTNNYYLNFKPPKMVDDVLVQAKAMGLRVIRLWAYIDRGSLDGTVRHIDGDGTKEGVYTQYWDTEAKRPAYNDGEDGLKRLDYVLTKARELDLKLIMVLTNSWKDFGGMDQYLVWYGLDKHHLFYTDPRVKQAYKDWVAHLVGRVNSINGVAYREDPAIFAWELANEPRCKNATPFSTDDGWDDTTITKWADEMSAYIKSIDPNHLVSVGDEGFFADTSRKHWTYGLDGRNEGVDHAALLALKGVDFGTYHLYPDHWGTDWRWGHQWIEDHIRVAQDLGKPTVLEEYGIAGGNEWGAKRRDRAYPIWNEAVLKGGGNAAMFWILSGIKEDGELYPDYDHFTVYNPSKDATVLSGYAARFQTEARACTLVDQAQIPEGAAESKFVTVTRPKAQPKPQARRAGTPLPTG